MAPLEDTSSLMHDMDIMKEDFFAFGESINIDLEDFLTHFHPIVTFYGKEEKRKVNEQAHHQLLDIYMKVQLYKDKLTQTCCSIQFYEEMDVACYHHSPQWVLSLLQSYRGYLDETHTQLLSLHLDVCALFTSTHQLIQTTWPDDLSVTPMLRSFMVMLDDRIEDMFYTQMDKCQEWIAHFT